MLRGNGNRYLPSSQWREFVPWRAELCWVNPASANFKGTHDRWECARTLRWATRKKKDSTNYTPWYFRPKIPPIIQPDIFPRLIYPTNAPSFSLLGLPKKTSPTELAPSTHPRKSTQKNIFIKINHSDCFSIFSLLTHSNLTTTIECMVLLSDSRTRTRSATHTLSAARPEIESPPSPSRFL
jgi:hypothetical protein